MKDDKCNECLAYEAIEYISPFHTVDMCHENSQVIENLSIAEKCECFGQINEEGNNGRTIKSK